MNDKIDETFFALQGWKFYFGDDAEWGEPRWIAVNLSRNLAIGESGVGYYAGRTWPITPFIESNLQAMPRRVQEKLYELYNP